MKVFAIVLECSGCNITFQYKSLNPDGYFACPHCKQLVKSNEVGLIVTNYLKGLQNAY